MTNEEIVARPDDRFRQLRQNSLANPVGESAIRIERQLGGVKFLVIVRSFDL